MTWNSEAVKKGRILLEAKAKFTPCLQRSLSNTSKNHAFNSKAEGDSRSIKKAEVFIKRVVLGITDEIPLHRIHLSLTEIDAISTHCSLLTRFSS